MIPRRAVLALGLSQLISWGVTYYLIGVFGEEIAADLGWSRDLVYGGFAACLLAMGLMSPLAGRIVDRHGGGRIMAAGALFNAAGLAGVAASHGVALYYASFVVMGVGMRLTLYDAAFAALARIGGPQARGPMAQITLLGGLASTVFWPLGHWLSQDLGWRGATLAFAGAALLTIPLCLTLPDRVYDGAPRAGAKTPLRGQALQGREFALAGFLYAIIAAGANFLNAGMSAEMIAVLTGLGLGVSLAVSVSTLRGVGQSLARLSEILFGGGMDPLALNLLACVLMPFAFVAGGFAGASVIASGAFAFLYGACNGVLTITRGTVPLVLFDPLRYGALMGALIAPSFIVSAAAPLAYALVIDRFGANGALALSFAVALAQLAAAAALKVRFSHREATSDKIAPTGRRAP